MTSDLRARLARLGYRDAAAPGEAPVPAFVWPSPSRFPHPIDRVVAGSRVSTPHGDCFVAEYRHAAGQLHGGYLPELALEVDPEALAWLGRAEDAGGPHLSRCVFLDTETTGLAGGTGTYTFLVGLGFFDGRDFVVRQYFMEDYDAEDAQLHLLEAALAGFSGVVTFNGRAFDLPLLETRFLMGRRSFPLRGAAHLDLLFPARRLWRRRLESCALSSLERSVLGVEREGDVPGWLIPSLYFDYVRTDDARPLRPVFEHNRLDLLSLATLAARLARQYADPFDPEVEDGVDLWSLACVFEDLGRSERAARCYERALELLDATDARAEIMVRLGKLYRRLRLLEDAVTVWRRLTESGHTFTGFAHVELAKHYEHAVRDYREAERLTLQALAALDLRAQRGGPWRVEQERRELEHRLARLRRKIGRSVSPVSGRDVIL